MYLGIPQSIVLGFIIIDLGVALAKDGQDRGKYSAVATFIDTVLILGLLYWGRFFS